MSYHLEDTIAAIATASGGAARGMIRISGPKTVQVVGRCFVSDDETSLDKVRQATAVTGHAHITLGETAASASSQQTRLTVPCDLFLWPRSRSYTRQPVAELHTLGSPPIVDAVLAAVCAAGARLAEPGEFSLRAFLAGRIDLTQAEAILGVIDAQGADELSVSLAQLAGGLARPLYQLREALLQLLAELEAGLDFVEEDIQFIAPAELIEKLHAASRSLGEVADQMSSRLTSTDAEQVALVGLPNAGKSSLFNALVERYGRGRGTYEESRRAALVSSQRGTTRDYLTATIDLDGVRCELVDTAGIEDHFETRPDVDSADGIKTAAQEQAAERRSRAAIRVLCSDTAVESAQPSDCNVIALTKNDAVQHRRPSSSDSPGGIPIVVTSSRTGVGVDELARVLRERLTRELPVQAGLFVAATAERCRESIRLAEEALRRAASAVEGGSGDELVAVEIRDALAELGKVVGAVYTDDLLDRIFSSFCIGK